MRTLKLHFPDEALPTLDTYLKQTKEARVFRRAQAVREVVKAGTCIEASFQRGKSETGMDAYQVRTVRRESTIEECGNTIGYTGIR